MIVLGGLSGLGLSTLASCGPEAAGSGTAGSPGHAVTAQDQDATKRPPGAREVDRASIPADKLVQAILEECHRPLANRMDRVKVAITLPNKRRLLIESDLPDRARVHEGLRDYLLANNLVHRLDKPDAEEAIEQSEADRERIRPLVRMVDAAAFGPLYRAIKCEPSGDDYVLTDKHGVTTTLRLHTDTLLPRALVYADTISVRFDGYLRTKSTWVVNKATLAPLGTCDVFFEDGGLLFASDFFNPPGTSKQPGPGEQIRMTSPGVVRERESSTPITVIGKAAQWVVLTAGGDWAQRHEMYVPVHAELEDQNQRIFGFPMIWQSEGQTLLGVPFRQREGGKTLVAPDDWKIASSPKTMQLVVYPPSGSIAERITKGTAQLQRAIANRKLKAIGPIIAQPFVHLHEGAPGADKIANCKVRMSVRLQTP